MQTTSIPFCARTISGGLLFGLASVTVVGCASAGLKASSKGAHRQAESPGVDPKRAYLPLDKIEPQVKTPARAESLKPLNARAAALIAAADALVAQERYTEGALKLEQALRYDPDHPDVHRALARLYWNSGNRERAKSHAVQALSVNEDDAGSHYLLGRCAMQDSDHAAAISEFRIALCCSDLQADPETEVLCHYYLGEALTQEGYLQAALDQYGAFERRAKSVDPGSVGTDLRLLLLASGGDAVMRRSTILEKLGRFDEAAGLLAPKVAAAPQDAELGTRYARLLALAGRIDEALAAARTIPFAADTVLPLLSEILNQSGHTERLVDELRSWSQRYPDEPSIFQKLAIALRNLSKLSEAQEVLSGYLARHPNHHDVRMQLLDLLAERRAWSSVLEVAAAGVVVQPNRTEEIAHKLVTLAGSRVHEPELTASVRGDEEFALQHLRGVLAVAQGRNGEAESYFRAALAKDPSFIPSRVALARLYLTAYQYDQALDVAARRSPEVAEDVRLEMVLGAIYECLDDLGEAERYFESATNLDPSNVEAMNALARVYRVSGQQLRAQRELQTIVQRWPENDEARESLAFLYMGDGKINEAVSEFQQLAQNGASPLARARASAIVGRLQQQDPDAFRQTLRDAMEQSGADATTWLAIADSYNDYTETQSKQQAYEQALALDPASVPAALGLVIIEQKQLDFEASAKRLRALLPRRPNRHRWRLGTRQMRGLLELLYVLRDSDGVLEISRKQEARNDISEATRVAYRLWILEGLLLAERNDEAVAQLRQWAEEDTDRPLWTGALAEEYLREDRPGEAVSIYESVLRNDPQNPDVKNNLIGALVADKRNDRAIQYSLDWLEDDPGDDRAVVMLTYALALAERVDEAMELIRNRLLTTINREAFQNLLVRHLNRAERHEDAIDLCERLVGEVISLMEAINDPHLRNSPESESTYRAIYQPDNLASIDKLDARLAELRQLLAGAYLAAQRYNDAERDLTSWLGETRDPESQLAYLSTLATCLQLEGQDDRAADMLEQALRLNPESVSLNNDLAYTWIDRGLRLDDAAKMSRFAVWSSPRQGAYLDTYGWLLYKKGEFASAKKWLLRAQATDIGNDSVVCDHLGDASWRLKEVNEAVAFWEAAVEADGKRSEGAIVGADARRVHEFTAQKIEAARTGGVPEVAAIAEEEASSQEPSP